MIKNSLKSHIFIIFQSDSLIIHRRLSNQSQIIDHSRHNIIFVKSFCSDVEGDFTRIGYSTWRVSDYEELVGC